MKSEEEKFIKRVNIFCNAEGIVVSADIESRSRLGMMHYTRVVLDPLTLKVVKETCSCEGYTFNGRCWHIELLEKLINEKLKILNLLKIS